MKEAINQLAQALTGKEHFGECTETELRQIVRLYPFFGPAHLLLAKKAKSDRTADESVLTEKASLYFPNPLWFEQLMNETGISTDTSFSSKLQKEPALHTTILETPFTEEEVVEQLNESLRESEISEPFSQETILETPVTEEEVVEQINEPAFTPDAVAVAAQPAEPALQFPSLKIEALDPGKMELSFEPYHTVDYFASQGIRFREEEKPKDRLSHQLKSFTEWLKTLKKLPASDIPATATRQEEKKVEQMAQVSITDREVVTEAMAEVWEKQGNAVKAVELYEKLSLLDPSKSSYFAAKIEHLKQL